MDLGRARQILYLVCTLVGLAFPCLAVASEYRGQVTFAGLPLPGATVTATQGTKKITAVTDQGGLYAFPDLADGPWKIDVEMKKADRDFFPIYFSQTRRCGSPSLSLRMCYTFRGLIHSGWVHLSNPPK